MLNADKVAYKAGLEVLRSTATFKPRVIRFFPETFMGNGHAGLAAIAKKHNVDVSNLKWGEYVIFMNTNQNALKLYSQGGLIAHLKMPGSAKIDLETISLIPRFFNGGHISYESALKEVIQKKLRVQ